ncbi:MAG: molecular chaperone TorD family protein [Rhodospirillales bacterium]|nr:molecular chaperone TorD family protein [Rhodospirillales bacterium]
MLARPLDAAAIGFVGDLSGDDSEFGRAIGLLARSARAATVEDATEEFNALFVGMGAGGELLPYASYYRTGLVYDKPLADLRGDLARLGIGARAETTEPEDHIAFMCEIMHGLIAGTFGAPKPINDQRAFFQAHLEPWAARFFADLEKAQSARLYAPLGTIGKLFMAIEREGFAADA